MQQLDNFQIEKLLGEGSFGQVYLTTRKGDSKKYATKKLDRKTIDSSDARKYLENEIRVLQYLNHPNIVKFIDLKKTTNHYYIMMEYANGGELSKNLEKYMDKYNKAFSEEIVQYLMRQIIDAFKYIHGLKIIHRDVKLENILLHYENEEDKKNLNIMKAQVKIIDFGFACMIGPNGLKYTALGSPINMDPLILKKLTSQNKKVRQLGYNEKADIWSLGTICYEMLIGKSAFNAEDMTELVEKVENGSYSIPTNISYEMASFLNGMLQYSADKRLTASQLSRHTFLTKNVNQFKKIDLKQISNEKKSGMIIVNSKDTDTFMKNKSIWSIFDKDAETILTGILPGQFVNNIDDKEDIEIKKGIKESRVELPTTNTIPDNPTDIKVTGMTKDELDNVQKGAEANNVKEVNYTFNGNIFDAI